MTGGGSGAGSPATGDEREPCRPGRRRTLVPVQRLGRTNPRLRALRRARRRRPRGRVIVDGRRVVEDLARWGVPIRELYLAEGAVAAREGWPPAAAALSVFVVADGVFETVAPTRHPQGVLAVVDEPAPARWQPARGVALFLDGVQDPGNVGAAVRSAAALGAEAVLLGPGCADPYHPAAVRGSAGAVFRVPLERGADPAEAAARARAAGGTVWAAAAGGGDARRWRPGPPALLLLGSEGRGLHPAVAAVADGAVAIPLGRGIESLNVAVAAALLLWAAGTAGSPGGASEPGR